MQTIIYLVRHGNSVGNVKQLVIGSTDVSLTKVGLKQGRQIAKYFSKKKVDAVYSSNLSRSETTAMYIAKEKKLALKIDERFAEFRFGSYENLRWTQALTTKEDYYRRYRDELEFAHVKFPAGESASEVVERFVSALLDIDEKLKGKSVVVVTHSVALMCFLSYLKNGSSLTGAKREKRLPNASITTLAVDDGRISLIQEGFTKHLDGITV